MKLLEKRRDEYLKDKNANVKIPMGIAYESGYKMALEDAANEFSKGGWIAKAFKIKDLWAREETN